MNNERYNQIIYEAYKNYQKKCESHIQTNFIHPDMYCCVDIDDSRNNIYRQYSQEEFITKCKTDLEFSERWGLKIEERELDMMERWEFAGRGYYKSAGGFLWSYDKLEEHHGYVGPISIVIEQYSLDNKLIQEFESICDAAKQLNISKSGIIRCCKGRQKKCGNFIFKYKKDGNI